MKPWRYRDGRWKEEVELSSLPPTLGPWGQPLGRQTPFRPSRAIIASKVRPTWEADRLHLRALGSAAQDEPRPWGPGVGGGSN